MTVWEETTFVVDFNDTGTLNSGALTFQYRHVFFHLKKPFRHPEKGFSENNNLDIPTNFQSLCKIIPKFLYNFLKILLMFRIFQKCHQNSLQKSFNIYKMFSKFFQNFWKDPLKFRHIFIWFFQIFLFRKFYPKFWWILLKTFTNIIT